MDGGCRVRNLDIWPRKDHFVGAHANKLRTQLCAARMTHMNKPHGGLTISKNI
jgi:hypothetical protein